MFAHVFICLRLFCFFFRFIYLFLWRKIRSNRWRRGNITKFILRRILLFNLRYLWRGYILIRKLRRLYLMNPWLLFWLLLLISKISIWNWARTINFILFFIFRSNRIVLYYWKCRFILIIMFILIVFFKFIFFFFILFLILFLFWWWTPYLSCLN